MSEQTNPKDAYAGYQEDYYTHQSPQHLALTDDHAADWALRKIAEIEARLAARAEFVQQELSRLHTWQQTENRPDLRELERMRGLLYAYYLALDQAGKLGARKSYRLPHGTLKRRTVPLSWAVDRDALTPWAKEQGLAKVEVTPLWAEIKARLEPSEARIGAAAVDTVTGEVLEAVRVERLPEERFSIDVGGKSDE